PRTVMKGARRAGERAGRTSWLLDEAEVLRDDRRRRLEEDARTVRVDRDRAVGVEERRDLPLRGEPERSTRIGQADVRQERVRVRTRTDGRPGEVVPEERRAVGAAAGPQNRRRG